MRARIVIIFQVISQDLAQLVFTDDDQMIHASHDGARPREQPRGQLLLVLLLAPVQAAHDVPGAGPC